MTGTRFPVSVRIADGVSDRHVSASVTGLKWRSTAPGGFHSASMTLNLDPAAFSDLGPADRLWIYGPGGQTLWEGFLDNPGRIGGGGGVSLDLSAMGSAILASDRTQALIYIDRETGGWEAYAKNISNASASSSDDPLDVSFDPGLLTQFNSGSPVTLNNVTQIGYDALARAEMEFGALAVTYKSGKNDTGYAVDLAYSGPLIASGFSALRANIVTGSTTNGRAVGEVGHVPAGATAIALRMRRTGAATNVTDDNVWTWFYDLCVLGRRMNRYGTLLTGSAGMQSVEAVRADWVVEDLLGRMLGGLIDPNASTVQAASFLIDQLAYGDGATVADVLDDLATYEPDFLWEMLHSTAAGYVFNYRAWPTSVRYEVSTRDGYDAPGSDFDLCNRVAVRWVDAKGRDQLTIVTADSTQYPALKALEDAGRVRDAKAVTLPEGRGSLANAQRVGEQVLASKADPPKAARVTVRRPIVDLLRGGTAMPYEIEPGYLVRVRETGDLLRLTEVEVDDEAGAAVLTLGEPVLTEEQRVARLENVARRRAA